MLLGSFAAVVCVFGAATLYADRRATDLVSDSEAITENAMPSVARLAQLRTDLHALERSVAEAVEQPPGRGEPGDMTTARVARRRIDVDLAAYEALPTFPGEREAWSPVHPQLAALERAYAEVEAALRDGDRGALLAAAHDFRADTAIVDAQIHDVVRLNVDAARATAMSLDSRRRRLTELSLALDAVAFGVAIVCAYLALRAVGRRAEELERRSSELEMFASRVAHDVRGPLGPALAALDMIERGAVTDDTVRVELARRGTRSLRLVRDIIEGLLAFARAGARSDPEARSDLGPVLDGVVASVRAIADRAEVEIVVEPSPPVVVRASAGALASVLSNLVRNAVDHLGDRDERRVTIRARRRAARLRVEVEDTGPGVPRGMERLVFEPYVRGARRESLAGAAGLGLGLATVKRLVEASGGEVGVEPRAGQSYGSVFWFELPVVA